MEADDDELEALRGPVLEYLVPVLESAMTASAERHAIAEGRGADGFSFGTDAWSLPARMFKDLAEDGSIPFQAQGPGCLLTYGATEIRHHRVGLSEYDDIASSFPNNAQATVSASQLRLFSAREYFGPPREVVLAYMANPQSGLCAAYLTRVGSVEQGKIVEWAAAIEIWRRRPGMVTVVRTQVQPPAERSPTPQVTLAKKRNEQEE